MQLPATVLARLLSITGSSVTNIDLAIDLVTGKAKLASFSLPVRKRFKCTDQVSPPDIRSVGNLFETALHARL